MNTVFEAEQFLSSERNRRVARVLRNRLPKRCQRLVLFLAAEGHAPTGRLANSCQIGNISSAVSAIQKTLMDHGLFIRNYLPKKPLLNRWGDKTQSHMWELIVIDEQPENGGLA